MLAGDKALSKQILAWHRIPCPAFAVFPLRTKKARLPLKAARGAEARHLVVL